MRYQIKIGRPGSPFGKVAVVEAPDELTAAYRAELDREDSQLEVLAIQSEEEHAFPVLGPESPRVNDEC